MEGHDIGELFPFKSLIVHWWDSLIKALKGFKAIAKNW